MIGKYSLETFFILLHFVLFLSIGSVSSAQTTPHIDSLLTVLKTEKEDTNKANTLHELCRAYLFELNDNEKVGAYGKELLALSQKLNFKKGMAYGYLNWGIVTRNAGDMQMALVYDKKSLELMKEIGNKKGESSCYQNIGLSYSNLGDYKLALDYMFKGVKIKEEIGDKKGAASGYNNIGNIYNTQGDNTKALMYHLKSLKIKEEINDKIGIAMSHNNIGNIFMSQNDLDKAFESYSKALQQNIELGALPGIGNGYVNIGNVYAAKKNYKAARDAYFKSLRACQEANDQRGVAESYNNIGNVYTLEKNINQALVYQSKSLDMYKKMGDRKGIAEASGGLGILYASKKDLKNARYHYSQMLQLAKELNFKTGIRDACFNFANLYTEQKQYDSALTYTKLYHAQADSILNKDNFKQVSELNTQYETDKKEKEILLLTKDQELTEKVLKQQQLVRWGLVGGMGLLSIAIFSVYKRYRFKKKANVVLEKQKAEIEQQNMLITDSIEYAKTIQETVLPTAAEMKAFFPQSFTLYKPKSVVSGDFYWITRYKDELICAVADCTGHGVPGGFMSMLGYSMLETAIKKVQRPEPASILAELNQELVASLSKDPNQKDIMHGMDIAIISINTSTGRLQFAGAHHPLYIIRKEQLIEFRGDRKGIGYIARSGNTFTNHVFDLKKGDCIYLFTDGYVDQIGGSNHKKFYYAPFRELLLSINQLPGEVQQQKLNETHMEWMGAKKDQTDDILVMGIRY
ncbi:MAG TPA: tetratricopeptide repeat protein [Bacteroidia bacterium]|jgi:serine phosphatase RsbU (regulator of sigma subunit)/predicted negative regulator of RcsB-dependent stress response|nr:tetratricopeptide repeat protein [Bacteroidia bacterium]